MRVSELRKKISYYALAIVLPYLLWSLMSVETRALYHPEIAGFANPLEAIASLPLRHEIQDVYFKTSDGVWLNAWYVPAKPGRPTIVFAHGNGGNIGDRWGELQTFTGRGYGFLAFDYRGYGNSKGVCSEQGLYRDMEAASRYLLQKGIPYHQQIALGGSLGSGVAVDVATRIPYRAVVLYAVYTSTPEVAMHLRDSHGLGLLGFLPLKAIMQQRFESLAKIDRVKSPLIIMHGDRDEMMPLAMPRTLFAKATAQYKKLLIIPSASHNTVLGNGQEQLLGAMDVMLAESALDYPAKRGSVK